MDVLAGKEALIMSELTAMVAFSCMTTVLELQIIDCNKVVITQ